MLLLAAGIHATFLKQFVSAIDSLSLLADALKTAKPGLLQLLKGAGLSKEVDGYFARTVDAAADLKEAIYLGAAKQLMPVSFATASLVCAHQQNCCAAHKLCSYEFEHMCLLRDSETSCTDAPASCNWAMPGRKRGLVVDSNKQLWIGTP